MKTIYAADLFCGGGGTSEGMKRAAESRGRRIDLTAVNHWETAVETHALNHPEARHLCQAIDSINPRVAVPGGRLDFLVASPECVFFSNARGARAMSEQGRATAWNILNWLDALEVKSVLIENVPEFTSWGPLYPSDHPDPKLRDRPIPELKSKYFRNFLRNLRTLGYTVDWRILTCADFGDATTRRRFFLRADKGTRRVRFPDASHHPAETLNLTGESWIPARDIIDWSLRGDSIFTRPRPLAEKTLRRIEAGLRKFSGLPFITIFRNNQDASSMDAPLPTITTSGTNFGICTPFVIGQQSCAAPRCVSDPLPTVATAGAISLLRSFLVPFYGEHNGQSARCLSIDQPLDTVTTCNRFGLAQPFLVVYNGRSDAQSIAEPLDTVTTIDRFGLCQPVIRVNGKAYLMDIEFRMLQPHELAAAHSFPATYQFAGSKKDIVKQIGNSVPIYTAEALSGSAMDRWAA